MRATDLLSQLGRTVAYYPNMVKHFESVTATVLFCQFFYWHDKAHSSLGIYKTVEEITEETGLSYKEQLTARKRLVALGVLIENHKRLEHKIYYKINLDRVNELLESDIKNSPYDQTETGGEPNGNVENDQNGSSLVSKITTEITTDIYSRDKSLDVDDENIDQPADDLAEEIKTTPNQSKKIIPYQKIVDIYNDVCGDVLPRCLKLDKKRKANIQKCWNSEFNGAHPFQNLECWRGYFNDCLENKFWCGENNRGWKADIEFVTRESSVLKILEGE